jgi:hypothetical protein
MKHPVIIGTKKLIPICLVFAAVLFIGADTRNDTHFMHTVKKGESVSLICIDYYGYYSTGLGNAIRSMNPAIKNINLVYPGQKLKLRKAQTETAHPGKVEKKPVPEIAVKDTSPEKSSMSAETVASDSLFVRKVNVTQGVVTCVEGKVVWQAGENAPEKPLGVNMVLSPGAIITTRADGRVEIIINRESVVRMRENTRMVLEAMRVQKQREDKTRVGCSIGSIWTKVKKFKDRISRFELELPKAIAGVHGTVYESTVSDNDASEVRVFNGEVAVRSASSGSGSSRNGADAGLHEVGGPNEVGGPHEVSMEEWTRIVRSMQKITIDGHGKPSQPVKFSVTRISSWEAWNIERDRRIAEMFRE